RTRRRRNGGCYATSNSTSVERHHARLVEVIRAAHDDGVEIAGLLAAALGDVTGSFPAGEPHWSLAARDRGRPTLCAGW
ncbi:MAG: hypothetical protein ACRDKW_13155, partial [Actinomycetota bacterium]